MRFLALSSHQSKNADGRNLAGQRCPQAFKICLSKEKVSGSLPSHTNSVNRLLKDIAARLTASSPPVAIKHGYSGLKRGVFL
jgi:hypothetical protein